MTNKQITSSALKPTGHIKIWRVHKQTGAKELLVDKSNTILYSGADLMALALAGTSRYAFISHMYLGYKTTASMSGFTPPTIDKAYSVPFTSYDSTGLEDLGYLRLPLAFSPNFLSTADYDNNTVIFTAVVTTGSGDTSSGAVFHDSDDAEPSHLFELGLVAALNPLSSSADKVFSRTNFEPIIYDPNYNLTVSWGIQFTA